jgi:hypothetical protein
MAAGLIPNMKALVMGRKSDEFRAQARRLEERAGAALDEKVRVALFGVAGRWRGLAREAERYERAASAPAKGPGSLNRKAAVAALGRAVRIYGEHEKARDLPDFLTKLAEAADNACLKTAIRKPSALPEGTGQSDRKD